MSDDTGKQGHTPAWPTPCWIAVTPRRAGPDHDVRAIRGSALLVAYFEAAQADSTAALLGPSGAYSHVLIKPSASAFARWLAE
ncbi:hypothetical protein AB0L88_05725 [Saccharopolyspora shandongensis]|uniref:hypothetical protein n=1 Tax=Saccharopolyspora shandongensis TaxID=418495 RepID=UPI003428721F